jgi:hypothetical protein
MCDIPIRFHGAVTAGVGPGSTVYVAGAGPVGLAAAASAHLLGAAVVIVGDTNPLRLAQARSFGCETIDVRNGPVVGAPPPHSPSPHARVFVCVLSLPLHLPQDTRLVCVCALPSSLAGECRLIKSQPS